MTFIWRCHLCIDCGQADTEPAAARAFLEHYCHHHPDPIAKWNHDMKKGTAA